MRLRWTFHRPLTIFIGNISKKRVPTNTVCVEVCHNTVGNNCKHVVGQRSRYPAAEIVFFLCGGCKVCFTHSSAHIEYQLSVWEDEGIPDQFRGHIKNPDQSLMSIVKHSFSGQLHPLPHSWDQLHCPLLSPPASVLLPQTEHTHTDLHDCKQTHRNKRCHQGILTIPAEYPLSPSNQLLYNFWLCTYGPTSTLGFSHTDTCTHTCRPEFGFHLRPK